MNKIEPYKDEETFKELVEKKENLDGKYPYDLEGMKREFRKYIDE